MWIMVLFSCPVLKNSDEMEGYSSENILSSIQDVAVFRPKIKIPENVIYPTFKLIETSCAIDITNVI